MHVELLEHLVCPACRSTSLTVSGGDGTIVVEGALLCANCGAEFPVRERIPVLLRPSDAATQLVELRLRDDTSTGMDDPEEALRRAWRHHYIAAMDRAVDRFIGAVGPGAWIADIGIGWGWHWRRPIEDVNVVGVDFSFRSLRTASRILGERLDRTVHLVCADAAVLPLRSIDAVWSVQVLQHIPPHALDACMRRCAELLGDGGVFESYGFNRERPFRFARTLKQRLFGSRFYLHDRSGREWAEFVRPFFPRGEVSVGHNEVLFHPEAKLAHRLPLAGLDEALGSLPLIGRRLANQVRVRVVVPPPA